MASASAITIRKIPLEYPADLDAVIMEGLPEESFVTVGLSLLLPYLEPYLIRSLHAAKPRVGDPALVHDIEQFSGQEAQHYKQHIRFNKSVRLAGYPKLEALERELEADYARYTATRSLRFNVAYAEGFEAYTMAFARFSLAEKTYEKVGDASVRDLLLWHLVEELEHRTVAFDVYDHVFGGWVYRLFAGLYAQIHLNQFVFRVAFCMLFTDRVAFRTKYGGAWSAWKRLRGPFWKAARTLVPNVLATYLPWYSPHRIPMPATAVAFAEHYSRIASSTEA